MLDSVLKCITLLQDTSSIKEKQSILEDYASEDLQKILKYTYDPFIQFYLRGDNALLVQKINNKKKFNDNINSIKLYSTLNKLSNRIVTGHEAIYEIFSVIENVSTEECEFVQAILNKDLRCNISAVTINKVFPKLCEEYKVMLCDSLNVAKSKKIDMKKLKSLPFPVKVDIKQDGVRGTYFASENVLKTRNGNIIRGYDHILSQLKIFCQDNNYRIVEGELKASTLNKTMEQLNRIKDKDTSDFKYIVFDCLENFKDSTKFFQRHEKLESLFEIYKDFIPNLELNQSKICNNEKELLDFFNSICHTEEGVVVKLDAIYEFKRSKNWLKLKLFTSEDLKIIRCEEGQGRLEGMLGAFIVDYEGKEVNVGSGFSDSQRKEYWENKENLINKIIEVSFKGVTPDGSLQFPSFVKLREDL